jgi:hypothetical protein
MVPTLCRYANKNRNELSAQESSKTNLSCLSSKLEENLTQGEEISSELLNLNQDNNSTPAVQVPVPVKQTSVPGTVDKNRNTNNNTGRYRYLISV